MTLTLRPPRPTFWTMRCTRIATLSVLLFVGFCVAETMPYLGLPLESQPTFLDCYRQATWNGKMFVETGKTICLGALSDAR